MPPICGAFFEQQNKNSKIKGIKGRAKMLCMLTKMIHKYTTEGWGHSKSCGTLQCHMQKGLLSGWNNFVSLNASVLKASFWGFLRT